MAAILDFRTFMGQILIDFFWSFTISSRIENRLETFCYNLLGVRVVIYIYLPVYSWSTEVYSRVIDVKFFFFCFIHFFIDVPLGLS